VFFKAVSKDEGVLFFYDLEKKTFKRKQIKNFRGLFGNDENMIAIEQLSESQFGKVEISLLNHKGVTLQSL
jgi:hypothetical protein